jgi:hypothetical protein
MTVSEQIIHVLDALCEKFGLVVDWTSDNIIPYIAELATKLVSWEIWTSIAWIGIMLALCIVWWIVTRVYREPLRDSWDDGDLPGVFAVFFSIGIAIVTGCVICTQVFDIVRCITFPEMYVFEYIQGLINAG